VLEQREVLEHQADVALSWWPKRDGQAPRRPLISTAGGRPVRPEAMAQKSGLAVPDGPSRHTTWTGAMSRKTRAGNSPDCRHAHRSEGKAAAMVVGSATASGRHRASACADAKNCLCIYADLAKAVLSQEGPGQWIGGAIGQGWSV